MGTRYERMSRRIRIWRPIDELLRSIFMTAESACTEIVKCVMMSNYDIDELKPAIIYAFIGFIYCAQNAVGVQLNVHCKVA